MKYYRRQRKKRMPHARKSDWTWRPGSKWDGPRPIPVVRSWRAKWSSWSGTPKSWKRSTNPGSARGTKRSNYFSTRFWSRRAVNWRILKTPVGSSWTDHDSLPNNDGNVRHYLFIHCPLLSLSHISLLLNSTSVLEIAACLTFRMKSGGAIIC